MKKLYSVKPPSGSPVAELAVCDGPRTHVIGRAVDAKPPRSSIMTVEKGRKPAVVKLPLRAAAAHVSANGFLVVGTDLSVHEGTKTFKKLTAAALKRPLEDEFGLLLGSMVAIVDDDEAVALVPGKKSFELRRWRRGTGWDAGRPVPDLVVRDGGGACIAWDATRNRVVVLGAVAKLAARVAELDGDAWTVRPTVSVTGVKLDVIATTIVGGAAVVALPAMGKATRLVGEGQVEKLYDEPTELGVVGLADGPALRNVREDGSELVVESAPIRAATASRTRSPRAAR